MFGKQKIAAVVAEFLGTGVLTLLILSVQRSTIGVPFFVASAAGLALALMVFVFGNNAGALFNPAITIALWTARKISTLNTILFVGAQLLGGWAAYGLYTYFVNSSLQPVGGHFTARIMVAEAVGAGVLGFGIAAAAYQGVSRAVAASFAGVSLMLGSIAASSAAIGLLNPGVALGVRAWVWGSYVLGPVVGAVIGVNLYALLFAQPGEAANAEAAAQPDPANKFAAVTTPSTTAATPAKTTRTRKASTTKKTTTTRKKPVAASNRTKSTRKKTATRKKKA